MLNRRRTFGVISPTSTIIMGFRFCQMVLVIGTLLVVAIVSTAGAAPRPAATDSNACISLEVNGLNDCPELKLDGSVHDNPIIKDLLTAKAEMLRQVVGVLTDPASAGDGANPNEPLLLVNKLATDEADAVFSHGSWSPSTGGFNRWVDEYHRNVLGGTRPVMVVVHGDEVCDLEKELSTAARMQAEGEDIGDLVEEEPPDEVVTITPKLKATNDRANSTDKREGRENFEVPVVLMTLGWDANGDPTHPGHGRDLTCAYRVLEMDRMVLWFTSHTRRDSYTHEKFRYVPIGFGGFETRSGLPQAVYINGAKRQLDFLETCSMDEAGSYDLLFQCSNMFGSRSRIWEEMTEGKAVGSPIPVNRFPLEPVDMVTASARGIFAVSPPGTGPDCFRHYEMMLLGNIALVPDEPSMRTFMDGLPAFFFEDREGVWGNLTCGHLLGMAEMVQAKIREGKESGGGLQFEKLTHGFWRRYIRLEALRAVGATDERALYMQRPGIFPYDWTMFLTCLLAICTVSALTVWRKKRRLACCHESSTSGRAVRLPELEQGAIQEESPQFLRRQASIR